MVFKNQFIGSVFLINPGGADMKSILEEFIPCWYELSWRSGKKPSIILRIHKDFISATGEIPAWAPIVNMLKKDFNFSGFDGKLDGKWLGFEKALRRVKQSDEDFVVWAADIPKIKKRTQKKCGYCGGSGQDEFIPDKKCLMCKGKGKEYVYDWQGAYAISASFTVFFRALLFSEKETSCSLAQLMTILTITDKKQWHGGSLSGEFSFSLVEWLRSLNEDRERLSRIVSTMKAAHRRMVGLESYQKCEFRLLLWLDGGLCFGCPGNACGINPAFDYKSYGTGHKFSCHNVDTALQQITLLSGLAALHDMARKAAL